MELTPEQQSWLRGEAGEAVSLAMKTLVAYGDAFQAKRMAPIKSAHCSGSFGALTYKAYYLILERLTRAGARVKVLTTCNPSSGHDLNFLNRHLTFNRQEDLSGYLAALGVTPNYSCVCYEGPNVPEKGDVVAWAESSAVQFANSAIGARTNRNSILIDICSAITGVTPEFGYLLDDNRRARLLVKLDAKQVDPPALGFILGQKAVNKVPVIEHHPFSRIELKNMGGAMAAAGAVALFHVEGVTPEAPDIKTVCGGEPEKTITITQADLDGMRSKITPDMVIFGCPQMTFDEASAVAQRFIGRRSKLPVWFTMIPADRRRFEEAGLGEKVRAAGVTVYDHCPLAALTMQFPKRKKILTPSGKLYYYLQGTNYGTAEDCFAACGV